jgi:NAD(P)H-dependent FMN reductase
MKFEIFIGSAAAGRANRDAATSAAALIARKDIAVKDMDLDSASGGKSAPAQPREISGYLTRQRNYCTPTG